MIGTGSSWRFRRSRRSNKRRRLSRLRLLLSDLGQFPFYQPVCEFKGPDAPLRQRDLRFIPLRVFLSPEGLERLPQLVQGGVEVGSVGRD